MRRLLFVLTMLWAVLAPAWAQQVSPAPNSQITNTAQPQIRVTFSSMMRSARIWVDGREFTAEAQLNGQTLTWTPNYPLDMGQHKVMVEGLNILGLPEKTNWSFTLASAAPVTGSGPTSVSPTSGAVTDKVRHRIMAEFPENIQSARISLDAQDLQQVSVQNRRVTANPNFDMAAGRHTARVEATGFSGRNYTGSWDFVVQGGAQSSTLRPTNLYPPGGTVVTVSRPQVSGDFPAPIRQIRLLVDKVDFSSQVQVSQQHFSWTAPYDLSPGAHEVSVEGTATNGQQMAGSWNFQLQPGPNQPQPPQPGQTLNPIQIDSPQPEDGVHSVFDVEGQTAPKANVRVNVRTVNPQGRIYTFNGQSDRAGYFRIPVSTKWANRGSRLHVHVTAVDRKSGAKLAEPANFEVNRR